MAASAYTALRDPKGGIAWQLPSCFLLVGKPGKGKSHMTKHLLYDFITGDRPQRMQFGMVMCSSASIGEYSFLPQEVLTEGYDEAKLVSYVDALVSHNKKLNVTAGNTGNVKVLIPHNFIVLDDLVGLLNSNSKAITQFITTFRKTNTSVIICTQYLNRNISPTIRECINYAILFNTKTSRSLNAIFEAFGGLFENFKAFKADFFAKTQSVYLGVEMACPAVLYYELEEEITDNYLRICAPAKLPTNKIAF